MSTRLPTLTRRTLICAAACSTTIGGALAAQVLPTHIVAAKQTGASLLARLSLSTSGKQQLAAAGISTAAAGALQQSGSSDGWPASFNLNIDATHSLGSGIPVGLKSITASFQHRGVVAEWDNAGQLAVTWIVGQSVNSTSTLAITPLPAGWYLLAINLHFDGAIPAGTTVQFSDAYGSGSCVFDERDAQGNSACLTLWQIRVSGSRDQFLMGLRGAAQARFLGVTLSRVRQ
jgi:hypothetical protein